MASPWNFTGQVSCADIWNMQNVVFYRKENEVCPYLRNNWSKKHRSATSDVIFNQDGFLDFASKRHSVPKLADVTFKSWMDGLSLWHSDQMLPPLCLKMPTFG